MKKILSHWPLIITIIIFGIIVAVVLVISLKQNQGHFIYSVDDVYIHMAVAKNFALHQVWGVTKYEFSSSTSSLLWPLLLAMSYVLFGVNELSPLILNILFVILLIFYIYLILSKQKIKLIYIFFILLIIIFLTPVIPLVFTGLEHNAHIFLIILFVYLVAQKISQAKNNSASFDFNSKILLLLSPFLATIRYEGLFLIFIACVLLALRKQWLYSFLLGLFAIIPIVIYGLISVRQGWFFLPNPIVLKGFFLSDLTGSAAEVVKLSDRLGSNFSMALLTAYVFYYSHIFFLVLTALILYIIGFIKKINFWDKGQIILFIFIIMALWHMQSVVLEGAFYRYQAPLISFGLFSVFLVLFKYSSGKIEDLKRLILEPKFILVIIFAVSFLSTVLFLGNKMPLLIFKITQASTNIYGQQYQMGLFLKQFYQGKAIAATDIGAISYLADIKSLDLYGLGSIEVAKNKINNTFSKERIAQLVETNDVKIAILYDRYFKDRLSVFWVKVGKWKIENNIVCDDDTSFYATESEEKDDLFKNLKTFSQQLPPNVSSTIYN